MSGIPTLIIFGQTAIGKTELLNKLFSSFSCSSLLSGCAEIVNADSVQVYSDARVASAMPDEKIMKGLPHHLVSYKTPFDEFSTSDFVSETTRIVPMIYERKKLPVLAGGVAFFIANFIYGLPTTPKSSIEKREWLQKLLKEEGNATMYASLKKVDPISAKKIHINDTYRVLRALEVYYDSNVPLSSYKLPKKKREGYNFFIVYLWRDRKVLYERIEKRVDAMAKDLQYEFRCIYKTCLSNGVIPSLKNIPLFKSIGYREFFDVEPNIPCDAAFDKVIALIKRDTKRYAKRQETFFKRLPYDMIVNMQEKDWYKNLHNAIVDFYESNF